MRHGGIGAHDPVCEGRVADREVEAATERATRVVLAAHPGLRMHEAGDPRRHRVILDAGQAAGARSAAGSSAKNSPVPMPGSSTRPPSEAEPLGRSPESTDDRLGGVVRILGRALQGGVFGWRDRLGQVPPELFPAWAEAGLARQGKAVLRQLGRAKSHEAQQRCLLLARRRAAGRFELLAEPDRGEVVAGAGGPAARKPAIEVQMEIGPGVLVRRQDGRDLGAVLVVELMQAFRVRLRRVDGPAESGVVEQAERELAGVGHDEPP